MSRQYQALNDKLIIERIEEESDGYATDEKGVESKKTEGGIILVKTEDTRVDRRYSIGKVVSAGRGVVSGGTLVENQCKEGDTIYYYADTGIPLTMYKDKELFLLKEEHVVAILN